MFRRVFLLLRLLLKGEVMEGMDASKRDKKRRRLLDSIPFLKQRNVGGFLLMAVLFLYLAYVLFKMTYGLAQSGATMNFFWPMFIQILMIYSFLTAFLFVISCLYHSESTSILLTMPFRADEIVAAKLLQTASMTLYSVAILAVPAALGFGMGSQQGFSYYVQALLIILFSPFLVSALPSLLVMLIMRFTKFLRNKDTMTYLSSGIGLILALYIVFSNPMSGELKPELIQSLTKDFSWSSLHWLFFGSGFAVEAGLGQSYLSLLFYLLSALAWFALTLLVARGLYFKTVMNQTGSSKRVQLNSKELRRLGRRQSGRFSYWKKEWKVLFRTPALVMNNLLGALVMPVVFLGAMFFGGAKAGFDLVQDLEMVRFAVRTALMVDGGKVIMVALLILIGVSAYLGSVNGLSCISISKEGQQAWLMLQYPISLRQQLLLKLSVSWLLSIVTCTLIYLPAVLLLAIPLTLSLLFFAVILLSTLFINLLGLVVDMRWPKLSWIDETQMTKRNPNVLIEMFGGTGVAGAMAYGLWQLTSLVPLPVYIGLAFGMLLLVNALFFLLLELSLKRCVKKIGLNA